MTQNLRFTPTQMAILMLLKSEDIHGIEYSPIPGRIHLVKELFAISQNNLGKKLLPELKFIPYKFGPFDETIFAALEGLRDGDFVSFDVSSSNNSKIKLTPKGIDTSDALWDRIKDDVKTLFVYTKKNFNHLSSERVLEKIYSAYPDMTVNSQSRIAEKYRPKSQTI